MKKLAWLSLVFLPACLLQPKPPPGSEPRVVVKKRQLPVESWQTAAGGTVGVAPDKKGSKGSWSLDDGPKPMQRSLQIDYDLKSGGFVSAWRTTEHMNLTKADGLRFMAKADPPCTVQLALADANKVSYIAVFQVASKTWTEIRVPIAALDKNPNFQPDDAIQGKPPDWTRVQSMGFDARTDGQGKFWIGPVYADEAQ